MVHLTARQILDLLEQKEKNVGDISDEVGQLQKQSFNKDEHDSDSRREIIKLFLKGYFRLIAGAFVFVFGYNILSAIANSYLAFHGFEQIKYVDVVSTISIVTTSLSGSFGFMIGYYFKGKSDNS